MAYQQGDGPVPRDGGRASPGGGATRQGAGGRVRPVDASGGALSSAHASGGDHDCGLHGRARPRLTSRAAVLAVVMCAIALSLAYPVREYIAQHREIDQLEAQHKMEEAQVRSLEAEQQRLNDPAYIEDQARARLNMCLRKETCYVIINGHPRSPLPVHASAKRRAWYATLWTSVQQVDRQASP